MKKNRVVLGAITLGALILLIVLLRGCGSGTPDAPSASTGKGPTVYSCPMHPQIRQPEFGTCPICGMDLVLITEDDSGDDREAPVLQLSQRAIALLELQTAPVERRTVEAERRFLGKFVYDETRLHDIIVRTEGQIQRLFVNYTGIPVRRGEHIAEIYSPEFYSATRDLLVAQSTPVDPIAADASRRKLHLLQVVDREIDAIIESGQPAETFTLYSPVTGVLTELGGRQGAWLMKGQRVAQIADLSSLWVLLDAYESDVALIHYGQQVQLDVPAFPGRPVTGFVAYVAPDLDERTRTIKVRLNVPNPDGRLRPGMFARASLQVPLTSDGGAYGPELAGKWICPMHPEITDTDPADCTICGMPLEPAESLGHLAAGDAVELPLVIPATAPLLTGKRALVYVQVPNRDRPTFEGRTVTLGPRAGEHYLVLEGLEEGEIVVTHGSFKIDSELQIRGRPSMMAPATDHPHIHPPSHDHADSPAPRTDVPEEFGNEIARLSRYYLELANALAADDLDQARSAAAAMDEHLHQLDTSNLEADPAAAWEPFEQGLHQALHPMRESADIETLREQLVPLTRHMEHAIIGFGAGRVASLYRAHCPMAFGNKGADWLQADQVIANPYFGARMFRCGEITGEIP
jgi:membrane fusion protein, copper/silver efflux system